MADPELDQHFAPIRNKMEADGLPPIAIETFRYYYAKLREGTTGLLSEEEIEPVEDARDLETMEDLSEAGRAALDRCIMLKLNGGLGTSMGLDQAKSLLPARDDRSFLEIIARQILDLRSRGAETLPLVLMNSFSTDEDSLAFLRQFSALEDGQAPIPLSFLQHRVPRLDVDTLEPVSWPAEPEREWCPPGHGDIYTAMISSGLLETLLESGYRYAFVSNADNLGATLDERILGLMAAGDLPFLMEVADRTAADRKGGHLARNRDGRLVLRESAQCPEGEQALFQDVTRYRYFNTNNIWINLESLDRRLQEQQGILGLPMIRNTKHVDPRDASTPTVIQVETAMGSAIQVFEGADILRVPRTRFAPVKTTDDLLVLWSDAYRMTEEARVEPVANADVVVNLDSRFYKKVDDFRERFPEGAPSLVDAGSLTVEGDILFEGGVVIRGDVTLVNCGDDQRRIGAGEVFQDVDESCEGGAGSS